MAVAESRARWQALSFAMFLALPTLSTGCISGLDKSSNAATASVQANGSSTSSTSASGFAVYQTSFYAFAETNCAECHGTSQAPLFAVTNATTAYQNTIASGFINFNDPTSSLFITQAENGHCGAAGCTGNGAAAQAALTTWAAAEVATAGASSGEQGSGGDAGSGSSAPPSPTPEDETFAYMTPTMPIPSPLPLSTATSGANYALMRWNLSNLSPANPLVEGAVLEIEIQYLNSDTYRIFYPRIAGLSATVQISGVHVLIKKSTDSGTGEEDPVGNYWDDQVFTASPSTLPSPLPSTPFTTPILNAETLPISVLSARDDVTIGFDAIATVSTLSPTFSSISANIFTPLCVSCHGASGGQDGVNLTSYAGVMAVVKAGSPSTSSLYTAVTTGSPRMPDGGSPLTSAQTSAISTWISGGALNN